MKLNIQLNFGKRFFDYSNTVTSLYVYEYKTSYYTSIVESLLWYGILTWGNLHENKSYSENILDVRMLYFLWICVFVQMRADICIGVWHQYGTRSKSNGSLTVPNKNTDAFRRSLKYIGSRFYNSLSNDLKKIILMKLFRSCCTEFIFHNRKEFLQMMGWRISWELGFNSFVQVFWRIVDILS